MVVNVTGVELSSSNEDPTPNISRAPAASAALIRLIIGAVFTPVPPELTGRTPLVFVDKFIFLSLSSLFE